MRISFLFLFWFIWQFCTAQQHNFQNPLKGELTLSGNFGEVRGNHFHSGLDLRTGGVEGKSVFAIEDGYVSRIVVSPTGFGKALYINHPNGKTSVYAHLRDFAPLISGYVKEQQYGKKSFNVDINFNEPKFRVKKGELVAISGNSGGSGGPHVHFEIRETNGQIPENPLNYGFKVKDLRHPELQKLWIYEHSANGHVEGLEVEKGFDLAGKSGTFSLKNPVPIKAAGNLSFGIGALDRYSNSKNVCGIYSLTVTVNGTILHKQVIDRFPFLKKRMVNTHVDYHKRKSEKQAVYRTYISPGNKLELYQATENGGVIEIKNGKTYKVQMEISDHAGNTSTLSFDVIGQDWSGSLIKAEENVTDVFYPQKENAFTNNSLRLNIPKGCLYDTLKFKYDLHPPCTDCISAVHSIGKLTDTPLDKHMTVSIKLDKVSEKATNKAVVVSFDADGDPIAEGGTVKWNWITTRTRSFGDYAVMLDSIAPELRPKNFGDQTSTAGIDTLKFHFEDD
ncbi:MAG: M23 family metallopeptidase, partial [Flavobacteriales bacterium]|nr:M23 family metallopeptidase [Flavobacteriales bacterium]